MSDGEIRVILADDHTVVRTGLKAVLGAARDIHVIGEAQNGREAVAMAERLDPDVIVMDLTMPDVDGIAATKEITQKGLRGRVLVLTMHLEDDYLVPLMEAGAAGYLVKSVADRELVDAVRAVARGDMYVRPAAARVLAQNLSKRAASHTEQQRFDQLTQREQNVSAARRSGLFGSGDRRAVVHQPQDGRYVQATHSGEAWHCPSLRLRAVCAQAGATRQVISRTRRARRAA